MRTNILDYIQNLLKLVILMQVAVSCVLEETEIQDRIPSQCIWQKAPHNAFTDLIEFDGSKICCFREATSHLSFDGCIRIIKTKDGKKWESVALIQEDGYDLRDPKLSITPDNGLMLIYGRRSEESNNHPWTRVIFMDRYNVANHNISVEAAKNIVISNDRNLSSYWLWRVRWINNKCYGIAYKNWVNPVLVVSDNGVDFSKITTLKISGNEGDVCLLNDGRLLAVVRADNGTGYVGYSLDSGYENWEWFETNELIQCPYIFMIENRIFIGGRGAIGTTIFELINDCLNEKFTILGEGDYAYPGVIVQDKKITMSYYNAPQNHSKIFLIDISKEIITY